MSEKERINKCTWAAADLAMQLELQDISVAEHGPIQEDGGNYSIKIVLHVSEEKKKHILPKKHKDFSVR